MRQKSSGARARIRAINEFDVAGTVSGAAIFACLLGVYILLGSACLATASAALTGSVSVAHGLAFTH